MLIVIAVLALLNTYPVWISQNFVFKHKHTAMYNQASQMSAILSGLEFLTAENVGRIMTDIDEGGLYRVVICDKTGYIVYDNSSADRVIGRYAVFPEIGIALSGMDYYKSAFRGNAFESHMAMPIMSENQGIGAVYLYEYDSAQASILVGLRNNLTTFTILITSIGVILSIFVSSALTRRVTELMRAIRSVRDGNYDSKLAIHGHDELAQVAGQFNELTEILSKNERLRQQFVSDASHELKTPLTTVRLLSDSILHNEDMGIGTIRDFVSDIGHEIDRLERMTEKLLRITRMESEFEPQYALIMPEPVIRRAVNMLRPLAEKAFVDLNCEVSPGVYIWGGEDDLYQVLFNLIENGIKYNNPGGKVSVLCFQNEKESSIIVDDTGVGIPQEDMPRIFDRFYRVDKARSREAGGAGLGLSIVYQTLLRMNGTVEVVSTVGKGTRFTIEFKLPEGVLSL